MVLFAYFALLAYRLIARIMVSACGLLESLSKPHNSATPSGGAPVLRFVTIASIAPPQAPRLPSQYSGFGSKLKEYNSLYLLHREHHRAMSSFRTVPKHQKHAQKSRIHPHGSIHLQSIAAERMLQDPALELCRLAKPANRYKTKVPVFRVTLVRKSAPPDRRVRH